MHLAIDGYGADPDPGRGVTSIDVLEDTDLVRRFLDDYPDAIGMTKIAPPQVYTYRGKVPEDWGVSGFVIIAESHISIHTFPDRGYVNVDVFSCKDFDTGAAIDDVKGFFMLDDAKAWTMERGVEYSSPREAHREMVRERVTISSTMRRNG